MNTGMHLGFMRLFRDKPSYQLSVLCDLLYGIHVFVQQIYQQCHVPQPDTAVM
jgi:hypothetical protein